MNISDASAQSTGQAQPHDWFKPPSLKWTCCRRCGVIQRADGKNKPCRGPVRLVLRAHPEAAATAMTEEG